MSHFTVVKTQLKCKEALLKALEAIGYPRSVVEFHDTPVNLYGYHGDKRAELANIIIRRKHIGTASNDVGFVLQEDGTYSEIISDFDRARSQKWSPDRLDKFHQQYAKHALLERVNDIDMRSTHSLTSESVTEDGSIILEIDVEDEQTAQVIA